MLSSLLVLAACSDTPPEVTPTPEAAGFRFDIDPGNEQVSVTAVGMGALSTQQAGEARLLEPGAELVSRLQSTNFRPGNVLDIRATFENVTDDESFRQPFTFRPALTPEQGNYLSSSEPTVSDAALGGDGVLSPGETTSVLSFRVEHKGERFSYFVNAYAVVEETEGACGDTGVFNGNVTVRTQEDIDALRGCRVIDGDLTINTDASTLDFSPLDELQEVNFFDIINSSLTSLAGFEALTSVAAINITDNSSLTSIPEFEQLSTVEFSISISNNGALTSISGFGNLSAVEDLDVSNNASLVSIEGFGMLQDVGGDGFIFGESFSIKNNASLVSISGFESLGSVNSGLVISGNSVLTSIPEFGQLGSVGGALNLSDNASLPTFSGFGKLQTVGGAFVISQNPALTSVPEFGQLNRTGLRLDVSDNASLMSISGFGQLEVVGFNRDFNALDEAGFRITNNASLTSISGFGQLDIVFTVLVINANASLTSISGFSDFSVEDGIAIINNSSFNCSVAPQENLPFLPLDGGTDSSFGNLVDCPIE